MFKSKSWQTLRVFVMVNRVLPWWKMGWSWAILNFFVEIFMNIWTIDFYTLLIAMIVIACGVTTLFNYMQKKERDKKWQQIVYWAILHFPPWFLSTFEQSITNNPISGKFVIVKCYDVYDIIMGDFIICIQKKQKNKKCKHIA